MRVGGNGFRPGRPRNAIRIAITRSPAIAVRSIFPGLECQKCPRSLTTSIENIANNSSI